MRCDVVVVGGGPSGAVCALELARAGLAVTIIERAVFPRRKVCGEYINCGSIEQLESLGLYADLKTNFHFLRGMHLHTAGMTATLPFPKVAAALDRAIFDDVLLQAALRAGVRRITGRMTNVHFSQGRAAGISYEDRDGERKLESGFVIGADGCGSLVARNLGLALPLPASRRYAVGGHFRHAASDMLTMNVEQSTYFATNPLAGERMNVMLVAPQAEIRSSASPVDEWFERRAASLQTGGAVFSRAERIGERVSIGPLAHRVARAVAPGSLLVGDAAGFLNPFTGQGIFLALTSGRAAAMTIVSALAKRSSETTYFEVYDRLQRRERTERARLSAILETLAHMPAAARKIMRRLDADTSARDKLLALFCSLDRPSLLRGASLLLALSI